MTRSPDVPRPRYFGVGDALYADFGNGRCARQTWRSINRPDESGVEMFWEAVEAPVASDIWPADPEPVVADAPSGTYWFCKCTPPGHKNYLSEDMCPVCGDKRPSLASR